MRLNRSLMIAVLSLSCAVLAPVSAWAVAPNQNYVQSQFITPQLLVPPPVEGTKAWNSQIEAVLQAQRSLSPSDLSAIKNEQKLRVELFTEVLGSSFNREQLPKTFEMLSRVLAGTEQIVEADKKFWHTRRPYIADARVKLNVDPINESPSYPSGHTTGARVMAEVLGMIVPEKLAVLRARADIIAKHRIEAGVHYPSDVEGGRALAMLIVGALTSTDDFQDDLKVAKKEVSGLK